MTKFIKSIFIWSKRHTFHFVAALGLSVLTCSAIIQHGLIFDLNNKLIKVETKAINLNAETLKGNIEKNTKLYKVMANNYDSTNARIDNLDNIIEYDDKRRTLIVEIRKAIIKNTNTNLSTREQNNIANAIIDSSYEWNLTIPQILAQIKAESNFNPKALSHAGAEGLMQIIPSTLKYIKYDMPNSPRNLSAWNIHHNIRAGCFYMSQQKDEFGDYKQALMAYNAGPKLTKKYLAGEIHEMPKETKKYVPKILKYIEIFKQYGLDSL